MDVGADDEAGKGDGFDMFSESPTGGAIAGLKGRAVTREVIEQGDLDNLQDNWDDGEGYYNARPGEVIADSYRILGSIGKGVFSTVLECVDLRAGPQDKRVAVKLIRNVDIMRKAAEKEVSILTALRTGDGKDGARDDKYCVAFLGHLEHRRHTVLVFEMMRMNLRETVKKYGSGEGINVSAVRLYAKQLFVALAHMAAHGVVHADIKPDNILVSEDLKVVKICDFGSAFRTSEPNAAEPTPYLVSRFYRAPEIVLGLPYDGRLDLWSVATCIYEAFTGKVMFPGSSNNDMLRRMMAAMGPFPAKLLRAHQRSYEKLELESHFTDDLQFKHVDLDKVTGRPVMRVSRIAEPPKRELAYLVDVDVADVGAADRPVLAQVDDLLGKCLRLDPKRRLSLELCSTHPLFKL
jgi:serine/threonine-protein kinase PRP4